MRARGILLAAAVSLVGVLAGPPGLAIAASPGLVIMSPTSGSLTTPDAVLQRNDRRSDTVVRTETFEPVVLEIYAGASADGPPIQTLKTPEFLGRNGPLRPKALAPGIYTALEQQSGEKSKPVTFTVDIRHHP